MKIHFSFINKFEKKIVFKRRISKICQCVNNLMKKYSEYELRRALRFSAQRVSHSPKYRAKTFCAGSDINAGYTTRQ